MIHLRTDSLHSPTITESYRCEFIISPLPFLEHIPIQIKKHASAISLSMVELSLVSRAISVEVPSSALSHVISEHPFVSISRYKVKHSFAVFSVFDELAFVDVAFRIFHFPKTFSQIVIEVSSVDIPVIHFKNTLALSLPFQIVA